MSGGNDFIDIEEGLNRVLNNKNLYIRLLTKFKDETNLTALTDAINAADLTTAKEKAHTMKGIAANLSLKKLFLEVQELEAKVKEGIADTVMMKSIQDTFDETIKHIEKVVKDDGSAGE
jgi:HPt (histidine-containing phosphotransfer) domain-containing protein